MKFAAVKLLKRAPVEHTEKRRIRELLLLALRIAALVLLALAFARPFLASGAAVGATGVTMVALDTSYSMSAPGRFERAKQLAKDAISKAPSGNLVGVVTFDDVAEIVEKPSADRVLARSAVDRASTSFGSTRYRAGLVCGRADARRASRHHRRRHRSAGERLGCRRPHVGAGVGAHRGGRRRAADRRIWRSSACEAPAIGSLPRCATSARAQSRPDCTYRSTAVRQVRRPCRSGRTRRPTCRCRSPAGPPPHRSPSRIRAASRPTTSATPSSAIRADRRW